jgi:hypothetical protein
MDVWTTQFVRTYLRQYLPYDTDPRTTGAPGLARVGWMGPWTGKLIPIIDLNWMRVQSRNSYLHARTGVVSPTEVTSQVLAIYGVPSHQTDASSID